MLRVNSPHVQIRKVAHDANRERGIEARFLSVSMRTLERCKSVGPPRSIVIFRAKALLIGVFENLHQGKTLSRRLSIADPGRLVRKRTIKVDDLRPIMREARPPKIVKPARSCDRVDACTSSLSKGPPPKQHRG